MIQDLYREVILAHYRTPAHRRVLQDATVQFSTSNPLCGDELTVFARLELGQLVEGAYDAVGCSIVHASADMMVDLVKGRPVEDVVRLVGLFQDMMQGEGRDTEVELGEIAVLREVRRFPVRVKCALLPWQALAQGLGARG